MGIGSLLSSILDIYENSRETKKNSKPKNYKDVSDSGFSGNRKKDLYKVDKTPTVEIGENQTPEITEDKQMEK